MSTHEPTPREIAEAEATDEAIGRLLAGAGTPDEDATLLWLASALRPTPPPGIPQRVRAAADGARRTRVPVARWAAAVLAYLFLSHGLGNFFIGGWIADNLGQQQSPHALTEGSLALIAVGAVVALGAWRERWLPAAAAAGVPLGLAFGVVGLTEAPTFGAGAALHLSQAAAAVVLGWQVRHRWRTDDSADEQHDEEEEENP